MSKGNILLADDHPELVEHIAKHLDREGYCITTAVCGADALAAADRVDFDVVILDVHMPGMSGVEVCRRLKSRAIPVIFLTADDSEATELEGLDAGGGEYLVKPVSARVIERRVAGKMRDKERVDRLRAAVNGWKSMASTDELTKAKTRLHLRELPESVSDGGVVMVDVDHFKRFNDTFGHGEGDECLRSVASVLLAAGHTVVRMGGEEFMVFVREGHVGEISDSLIGAVAGQVQDPSGRAVTISVGAVEIDRRCDLADAIAAADGLLYESKRGGRNKSTCRKLSNTDWVPESGEKRKFRDRATRTRIGRGQRHALLAGPGVRADRLCRTTR